MAKFRQIYKCETCGNIVSVLDSGDGTMICCGTPMTMLTPSNGPEGYEKHVPIVTQEGETVSVVVGSVEHPMVEEHFIEWIELSSASKSFRKFLKPGDAPRADFKITDDDSYLVTIYCNIHGLWDNLSGSEDADTKRQSTIANNIYITKTERINMQETIKNLAAAFTGESQARNRYTIYSKVARNEGYEQIAAIFTETADQEKSHAKKLMEMIQGLKNNDVNYPAIEVTASVPNVWDTTAENLKASIAGEHFETTEMYPEFAAKADEEGLPEIASRLRAIAKAEAHHEERYSKLLSLIDQDIVFKRAEKVWWCCRECGYVHEGTEPPKVCPACDHPQAFYQLLVENY